MTSPLKSVVIDSIIILHFVIFLLESEIFRLFIALWVRIIFYVAPKNSDVLRARQECCYQDDGRRQDFENMSNNPSQGQKLYHYHNNFILWLSHVPACPLYYILCTRCNGIFTT